MTNFKHFYTETSIKRVSPKLDNWYHGDQNQRTTFKNQKMDRDSSEQDANEHGPGIYFTRSYSEALSYANPNGYVYTSKMNIRNFILKDKMKSNVAMLKRLIEWCPEERKIIGLSNWDEDPNIAFKKALHTYSNYYFVEATIAIYNDFYGNTEANEWANSMMNLGIDAYWRLLDQTEHLIVYNPSIINIINEEDYLSAYEKYMG